jgi:hypothetical protein
MNANFDTDLSSDMRFGLLERVYFITVTGSWSKDPGSQSFGIPVPID